MTAGSRGVRISGQTMDRPCSEVQCNSSCCYPLQSPISPSLPLPRVAVCHHVPNDLCTGRFQPCACSAPDILKRSRSSRGLDCCAFYQAHERNVFLPSLDLMNYLWIFFCNGNKLSGDCKDKRKAQRRFCHRYHRHIILPSKITPALPQMLRHNSGKRGKRFPCLHVNTSPPADAHKYTIPCYEW